MRRHCPPGRDAVFLHLEGFRHEFDHPLYGQPSVLPLTSGVIDGNPEHAIAIDASGQTPDQPLTLRFRKHRRVHDVEFNFDAR